MLDHIAPVVTIVSDPVCKVVQPVISGGDATLMCRMVYDWRAPHGREFPFPPDLDVSLSWDGMPGTAVTTTADPTTFRGTLETNITIEVMSETIPSYTCRIQFHFSGRSASQDLYQYAENSVSSTCVTQPTTVRRKFIITVRAQT